MLLKIRSFITKRPFWVLGFRGDRKYLTLVVDVDENFWSRVLGHFCEECSKTIVQGRTGYKIGGGVVGLLDLPKIIGVKCWQGQVVRLVGVIWRNPPAPRAPGRSPAQPEVSLHLRALKDLARTHMYIRAPLTHALTRTHMYTPHLTRSTYVHRCTYHTLTYTKNIYGSEPWTLSGILLQLMVLNTLTVFYHFLLKLCVSDTLLCMYCENLCVLWGTFQQVPTFTAARTWAWCWVVDREDGWHFSSHVLAFLA